MFCSTGDIGTEGSELRHRKTKGNLEYSTNKSNKTLNIKISRTSSDQSVDGIQIIQKSPSSENKQSKESLNASSQSYDDVSDIDQLRDMFDEISQSDRFELAESENESDTEDNYSESNSHSQHSTLESQLAHSDKTLDKDKDLAKPICDTKQFDSSSQGKELAPTNSATDSHRADLLENTSTSRTYERKDTAGSARQKSPSKTRQTQKPVLTGQDLIVDVLSKVLGIEVVSLSVQLSS
mgnify:CR=1 FL=1